MTDICFCSLPGKSGPVEAVGAVGNRKQRIFIDLIKCYFYLIDVCEVMASSCGNKIVLHCMSTYCQFCIVVNLEVHINTFERHTVCNRPAVKNKSARDISGKIKAEWHSNG